jgi:hypothetical protein
LRRFPEFVGVVTIFVSAEEVIARRISTFSFAAVDYAVCLLGERGFNQPLVTVANCASMTTSLVMTSRFLKNVAYWFWWAGSMNFERSSLPEAGGFSFLMPKC